MKITNIILTSQNGGVEQVFIDYMVILKKLGHDVTAIVKNDAPYADKVEELGIKVKKTSNIFGYYDPIAIKNIKNSLEKFDSDALIAHAGKAIILSRKAIKKVARKKILQVAVNHSMNVKRSISADIVISVNKPIFYRTIDLGQNEKTSFVVPNAVDLYDAINQAPQLDLTKKDTIIIGAMARLDKAKGFSFLIHALKHLEKISNKKFILKIAGTGQKKPYLEKIAKELNIEDKVEFLGWVKDKKKFYDSIDIFCMSSRNETFGLVLIEAIKYRKPVISTNADGPKEIIRDKIDGLLVELDPLEEVSQKLAKAIVEIIENPNQTNQMLQNSYKMLHEKFSFTALEQRIEHIIGKTK